MLKKMPKTFHNSFLASRNLVAFMALFALILALQSCSEPKRSFSVSKIDTKKDGELSEKQLLEIANSSSGKDRYDAMSKLADLRRSAPIEKQEALITELSQFAREKFGSDSIEYASSLQRQARLLFKQKNYPTCAKTWQAAGDIFAKKGTEFSCQLAECVSGRIAGECATGKCANETQLYQQLLELRRKCFGDSDQQTMIAVMLLGENYSKSGKYKDALKQFQEYAEWTKARSAAEQNASKLNIARTLIHMGEFKQGASILKECLSYALAHETPNEPNPSHVPILKTYILLYDKQKDYKQELSTAKELVDISERIMGKEHPQLPTSLMIYVEALEKAGKKKEAELVMQRIRKIEMSHPELPQVSTSNSSSRGAATGAH